MPCYQPSNLPSGVTTTGRTSYKTEAECLQACQEGACCEGTTCTVKPQCQCQGAGKTFKGVGTVCAGNPCGCCCINGNADATKNEQQCAAAGGTWKSYSCNSSTPLTLPLTLSLTNYTAPFQSGVGVRSYDFSCIRGSWTLGRGRHWNGVGAGYSSATQNIGIGFQVTTTGSFQEGYDNKNCTCAVPQIRLGTVACNPDVVVAGPSLNCAATSSWGLSNYVPLLLRPTGASEPWFTTGWAVSVAQLCSNTFSVSGDIYGPGDIQCGTFTLGNPLP